MIVPCQTVTCCKTCCFVCDFSCWRSLIGKLFSRISLFAVPAGEETVLMFQARVIHFVVLFVIAVVVVVVVVCYNAEWSM